MIVALPGLFSYLFLFYGAICFMSDLPHVVLFLCSSVLWRCDCLDRKLVLVLSVRLFDLCLFGFVCFLFLLVSWKAAVCDCRTPWTFLLPFCSHYQRMDMRRRGYL